MSATVVGVSGQLCLDIDAGKYESHAKAKCDQLKLMTISLQNVQVLPNLV